MLNALTALQTNVVATVRREPARLQAGNTSLPEQSRRQDLPFVLDSTPATMQPNAALKNQIDELIAVAQASARSAAGIEPQGSQASLYSRAAAAYRRIGSYAESPQQPLFSLSV